MELGPRQSQTATAAAAPTPPRPGDFVMYTPRRAIFATTSSLQHRHRASRRRDRPCLVFDDFPDKHSRASVWITPLTAGGEFLMNPDGTYVLNTDGTPYFRRRVTHSWWQPVRYVDGSNVPLNDVLIPPDLWVRFNGTRWTHEGTRPRLPITIQHTWVPDTTFGAVKPGYVWVGDTGESIPYEITTGLDRMHPYYTISGAQLQYLRDCMKNWRNYYPPEPYIDQPDTMPTHYQLAPPA